MFDPSSESPQVKNWIIHCDGSARPNPGRMAWGAVIVAPDGTRQTLSQASHRTGCNNEAELMALMASLRALPSAHCSVEVYSDNSVLVTQLMQPDTKPIARLAALFEEARELLGQFDACVVRWVPRHRNTEADALARSALGMPPKAAATAMTRHHHRR